MAHPYSYDLVGGRVEEERDNERPQPRRQRRAARQDVYAVPPTPEVPGAVTGEHRDGRATSRDANDLDANATSTSSAPRPVASPRPTTLRRL